MDLRRPLFLILCLVLSCGVTLAAGGVDANRLTYLDGSDPYHVGLNFPKLTTPQWVGEEGVEAVVVLAIDDLTDNIPKYEAFLRPILDRLKAIDGRAALSIMTCRVDPRAPELQRWIEEGVNLDVHTLTHPCPLLQKGDFEAARKAYEGCVDLLNQVPGNHPVAFRMPCCDSLNTLSPRFFAELFNRTSPRGHFLGIDSSVFCILTPDDPDLPRSLVLDPDGRERFRKYVPFPSFATTIENYPYPYVIGNLCWEFPCIVPSDWEANHLHKPNNPKTVEDLKAALDAVVRKQGVFNLVFHPHGWIKNEQIVELIDHAVKTHGKKVKFLNFHEAQERLNENLLGAPPLRDAKGRDNGVRLLDLNADGYLDVVQGNELLRQTRLWDPSAGRWKFGPFPTPLVTLDAQGNPLELGVRFGVVRKDGHASMLVRNENGEGAWHFDGQGWQEDRSLLRGQLLRSDGRPIVTSSRGYDWGVRLRDLDGDGICELIGGNDLDNHLRVANKVGANPPAVFRRSASGKYWVRLPFELPAWITPFPPSGHDAGTRFVDLDEDGFADIVHSDTLFHPRGWGIYLFDSMKTGWSRTVAEGEPGGAGALPPIAKVGPAGREDNGFWVHNRTLWWQNEDTAKRPDLVERRSFNDLLKDVEPRAKSPEASLASIRVRPGFRVELMACEPLVTDPIAFDWGADGKLWVLEMGDYPLGADGKGKPGGIVRFLEDTDGDGRYDKATTFLDGLSFPAGLLPWKKGVLVACAPDIFYAEDTDGDGKADRREVLFTGFTEGNPQHRVNGFDYGLDNWIYGANGDSGGKVRSMKTGKTVGISGRDFRFRPDDGRFETESGQTQYGRHRDDFGNWFGNANPSLGWHYVLAEHDLRRNPQVAFPDPKHALDPDTKLYPISRTLPRFNDLAMANRLTSANSPTPYRDVLFGPHFEHSLFVSEPVHNLIRRVVLTPEGVTFKGSRAPGEEDREFLASSDNWFRPTMLKTGPDGALWIADMYRAVIEHPEWIPDDWEAKLDLRAGHDQGRIYRVYPVDRRPRPIPRLDGLDIAGLVAALDSPNGWQRDTAQRLLVAAQDPAAIGPLRTLAAESPRAKVRIQALHTLEGIESLGEADVRQALNDSDPEVRRHAVELGEGLLSAASQAQRPQSTALGEAMARLADDPDARVRFQVALSVEAWDDPRAGRALARLLRRDGGDRWMRAAVLSAAVPHVGPILEALFAEAKDEPPPAAVVEPLFALAGSLKEVGTLTGLVRKLGTPQEGRFEVWQYRALAGLLDAAGRGRPPLDELARRDRALREALDRLDGLFQGARRTADDESAPEEARIAAVGVLGRSRDGVGEDLDRLSRLLRPQVPAPLQRAALASLTRLNDERVPATVLAGWKGYGPALRGAILDALLARPAWAPALLAALESGKVPPGEVDVAHRRLLLGLRDAKLRHRAEVLFARGTESRKEVLAAYRDALNRHGDPAAGAVAFKKVCSSCHRFQGEGTEVGPDLAALTDKSSEALLTAILDPNRAFEAKFTNYNVAIRDGRVVTGLIAAETATSVTLRRQERKEDVLLRDDIEEMASTGQSLMPEGVEKDLSVQDVADVIAYLQSSGPPRKTVAGNHPEIITHRPDGTIVLKAANAEIYGDTLTFESRYGNLGYWNSVNDRAVWRLDVEKPGRYAVWLDWACPEGQAGNGFVLEAGSSRVEGTVGGTGSWDDYRQAKVGEVTLEAGRQRLEVRPRGDLKGGALIDLRAVELRPVRPEAPASCCGPPGE